MDPRKRVKALEAENTALRKTVDALIQRVDGLLGDTPTHFDVFYCSVTLQQIVSKRTQELERITENARKEAAWRRKAEEILRSERRLLSSVLLHIPHLVSWKDHEGVYLGCNRSFARTVGLSNPDDIKGKHEHELGWKPADPELSSGREREVFKVSRPVTDSEESYQSADGQSHKYLVSTVPMHNDEGLLTGILSIHADITERKSLESQLLHAQKLESIGQLASGIAHEINTPAQYVSDNISFIQDEFQSIMGILKLFQSLLSKECPAMSWQQRRAEMSEALEAVEYDYVIEEIPNALEQTIEGLGRITHIVRAMKDFSHPGSGEKESIDLNQAIESTATVCSNRWKYASDLEMTLDPDLPIVSCHINEIKQVILNIIINAVDAIEARFNGTGKKGQIQISTKRAGRHVVIEIADNGGGIPQAIRHRIFDPFFTTKEVGKGTGQGLAISRDFIVQKHGGLLDCEVDAGNGTTFRILLPVHYDSTSAAAA